MALFVLFFLYSSPSGLVFYWTLNNVFSLVKTVFYKLKHPGRVLAVLASVCGLGAILFALGFYPQGTLNKKIFLAAAGVILQIPFVVSMWRLRHPTDTEKPDPVPNKKLFYTGALFLAILTGVTIPASVREIGDNAFSGCPKLTITAKSGSVAWRYAERRNIPLKEL